MEELLDKMSEQVRGTVITPAESPVPHLILGISKDGYDAQPMLLT